MNKKINLYGDNYNVLSIGRGSDISSQRIDDLDRAATAHAAQHEHSGLFLDLGCGFPVQTARFALLGKKVIAVDRHDFSPQFELLRSLSSFIDIRFLNKQLEELDDSDIVRPVSCIFSQRTIHYLHPHKANQLVSWLRGNSEPGCKCFISVSGMDSELGCNYDGKALEWGDRYCELSASNRKKHGIEGPVCLYRQNDLIDLMQRNGFKCETIYASEFGNIKGVFVV